MNLDLSISEMITIGTVLGGWIANYVATKHEIKSVKDKNATLQKDLESIEVRLDEKKKAITDLEKKASNYILSEKAYQDFVTRVEVGLMFDKINMKLDFIIEDKKKA